MPADDYAVAGGGALKLKGGKVQKSKKKRKDKSAANLERSLSIIDDDGGDSASPSASTSKGVIENKNKKGKKGKRHDKDNNDDADGKKFDGDNDGDDVPVPEYKTEAERRHEEIQRRKLLKMFEDGTARPELLKTHKERVEGLNTYLSKLSEHHDMPKIGPG